MKRITTFLLAMLLVVALALPSYATEYPKYNFSDNLSLSYVADMGGQQHKSRINYPRSWI